MVLGIYFQNRVLWSSINSMVDVIKELSNLLKDLPMSSYFKVKELLIDPSWKYLRNSPDSDGSVEVQVEINVSPLLTIPTETETCKIAGKTLYYSSQGHYPLKWYFKISIIFSSLSCLLL